MSSPEPGEATRWDTRWADATPGPPARVLLDFAHLLPGVGLALDAACGLGSNALFLAERGLTVTAWDLSAVAVAATAARLGERGEAEVRDLLRSPPSPGTFDVVVVARFLDRSLAPALAASLRPGGLLFAQTWARDRVSDRGPRRDAYRLAPGELLGLYPGLHPVIYREEGRLGDLERGWRDEALLVARRPLPTSRPADLAR